MESPQFEEVRKLSKLFYSAERLTNFLERGFTQWLPSGTEENRAVYDKFIELKLREVNDKVRDLESSTFFYQLSGNYEKLKPRIYLLNLLFTYLKNQASSILNDCEMELSHASSQINSELQDYQYEAGKSKDELKQIATELEAQYRSQYQIVENIVIPFLEEFEIIATKALKSLRGSYAFLINELSEEALQIDGTTERIGELLHLPKDKFDRVIANADLGVVEDGKHKKYIKPDTLTVNQLVILIASIRNTGGISRDVNNRVLGYHLERITNLSANKISQGLSNVPNLINEHKNSRDADDGHKVIEYLQKLILDIRKQID